MGTLENGQLTGESGQSTAQDSMRAGQELQLHFTICLRLGLTICHYQTLPLLIKKSNITQNPNK